MARNPFAVAVREAHRAPVQGPGGMRLRAASSYYAGAQVNRMHGDWALPTLSPDRALRGEIMILRNRARELAMSNSSAARVPSLFSENVIGKDGILLQARVRSTRDNYNERVNALIEDAWYRWCEAQYCSVDGRRSWCETETLIAENEPVDGEVLIRLVRHFDNPFGFAIDILDPDQLDERLNVEPSPGRNEIRMGIEMNAWGRPVNYHILRNHPSESFARRQHEVVPAADIIHLFIQRRPKQSRGVTWFAPVIVDLKMLGGYREAELVAARTASAKMGFLKQMGEQPVAPMDSDNPADSYIRMDADPGVIEQLPFGYEFQGWDPSHPSTAFEAFDKAVLRSIATALRVSYLSLSGDLSDTSYGSGRIGMLAERAVYEKLQQRHIERVSTPVYLAWLEMAMLHGALELPSYDPSAYAACSWHPRSFPWIDPGADIEAAEREYVLGTETLTELSAKKGKDYEETLRVRQRERELRQKYGEPEPAVGKAPPADPAAEAEAEEREEEDKKARESKDREEREARQAELSQLRTSLGDLREDMHAMAVRQATPPVVVNVPNAADTIAAMPAPAPVHVSVAAKPAMNARAMKLRRTDSNEWIAELVAPTPGDADGGRE